MPYIPFTPDQKRRANAVDLETFLLRRGEKLLPSGHEKRMASDHSVTIRGSEWFDHDSRQGGHAISFVCWHMGLSYAEAVKLLLGGEGGIGYPEAAAEKPPPKPFALPPPNQAMRRVFAYLLQQRCLDREVLRFFAHRGLLYEDLPYHNAVFVGLDEHGVPRHAHLRSTNSRGKPFRVNVEGSRPQYSFHHIGSDDSLYVFESPIDLLSFICLHPEGWQAHSYVSLCGTGGQAMQWLLSQAPDIRRVFLCLDSDSTGQAAGQRLLKTLNGYQAEILVPKQKDWNEDLCAKKNTRTTHKSATP